MQNRDDLSRKAEAQIDEFLRRSSITYLECCVSLMLTHMDKDQVAQILRQEAKIVEDFD